MRQADEHIAGCQQLCKFNVNSIVIVVPSPAPAFGGERREEYFQIFICNLSFYVCATQISGHVRGRGV